MSRFFATGSDSESEESSSADEITPKAPGTTFKQSVHLVLNPIIRSKIQNFVSNITTSCCFPRSLLLSDDEEDTKRVVRSAKDKRLVWHGPQLHVFKSGQTV